MTDTICTSCGHAVRRHDPEDHHCDAHADVGLGRCPCLAPVVGGPGSAYRRGNRDALLSLAAECDARAEGEDRAGDKMARHRTMGERLATQHYFAARAWRDAAALARRRAEALPEDPEEVTP